MPAPNSLQPVTWIAFGVLRRMRRELGHWPTTDTCLRIARAEGADPEAVLVLARCELPVAGQTRFYKSLLLPGRVDVRTAEVAAALEVVRAHYPDRIRAELVHRVPEASPPRRVPPLGDPRVECEFLTYEPGFGA